jgi:hypothetical protein
MQTKCYCYFYCPVSMYSLFCNMPKQRTVNTCNSWAPGSAAASKIRLDSVRGECFKVPSWFVRSQRICQLGRRCDVINLVVFLSSRSLSPLNESQPVRG